jgi:hypothetical protein
VNISPVRTGFAQPPTLSIDPRFQHNAFDVHEIKIDAICLYAPLHPLAAFYFARRGLFDVSPFESHGDKM